MMKFSLFRLSHSRVARVIGVLAAVSFVVLLRPYCDAIGADEATTVVQSDHHDGHGHGQPGHHETCPSLDHNPATLSDTGFKPVVRVSQSLPAVVAISVTIANNGWWDVAPRSKPPPIIIVPLYLRYAHLLM